MTRNRFPVPEKRRSLILPADLAGRHLRVAFFDADNTLREARSGKPSPHGRADLLIRAKCCERLLQLASEGYLLAIVSNQAGIKLGHISMSEVEEAMQATVQAFAARGIIFNYYDFAELYNEDRKPEPGMAWRLERQLQLAGYTIDWPGSFMVGDAGWKRGKEQCPDGRPGSDHSNSDRLFAENIALKYPGFRFFHPVDFFRSACSPEVAEPEITGESR
ncbi:MAG TPA: HAD-IIIA family hydrolase [Candidatus Rifleibacterium sp.]|nr:HAD-IIIA family hydrolase [Candidatus Rifleibacterium sp.]HPT45960.1 HAD-IIIA family hydrolase [Candidatus Rifleibacterium sp.]